LTGIPEERRNKILTLPSSVIPGSIQQFYRQHHITRNAYNLWKNYSDSDYIFGILLMQLFSIILFLMNVIFKLNNE
jgi:hypothetical protein